MATVTVPEYKSMQPHQAGSPNGAPRVKWGSPGQPLWPNNQQIEVIGLTGDYASGKTLFGLTIAPGPQTIVYDTEKSSGTYQSLGFARVDCPSEMVKSHPSGYKPIDQFLWWLLHVKSLPTGKFRVIMIDTISEIESGLVEYVRTNPEKFGYTKPQFTRMEGLMWGAVKDYWKSILADLAARCECFVFTSHLRTVWKGNSPTSKRAPKGKETLMELASVYLHMERLPDSKGNVPAVPAAVVLKDRLAAFDADFQPIKVLPPRLPHATPSAIRDYILSPVGEKLSAAERLRPEAQPTEADLEAMRLERAQAERDAEALRGENLRRIAEGPQPTTATTIPTPTPAAKVPDPRPDATVTADQLKRISELKRALGIDDDAWAKIMLKRLVSTARSLTTEQAAELIDSLENKLKSAKGGATDNTGK